MCSVQKWPPGALWVRRVAIVVTSVACLCAPASRLLAATPDSLLSTGATSREQTDPPPDLTPVYLPIAIGGISFPPRDVPVIPVVGPPIDRPAAVNPDVNLALRSYVSTEDDLTLVDVGGPTDDDPPQLSTLFSPARVPQFASVWQVYDWNWSCGPDGCRGEPLTSPPVTLLEVATEPGEAIHLPFRRADIYQSEYVALVLHAEETRITIKYTREDSPVHGYMIHLEDLQIDPAIVRSYREQDAAGRSSLPALRNGELVGISASRFKVAVRDTGSFMDPRVRKDWWQGF